MSEKDKQKKKASAEETAAQETAEQTAAPAEEAVQEETFTVTKSQMEQMEQLAKVLAAGIDTCKDCRALPQLTKQYRETSREIEEIEGANDDGDEIGEILAERESDGKPGAVRTHRAGVPGH